MCLLREQACEFQGDSVLFSLLISLLGLHSIIPHFSSLFKIVKTEKCFPMEAGEVERKDSAH